MSTVTQITYAISLDNTVEIIKQVWLNKKIDVNAPLGPTGLGKQKDYYIDMIRKVQPELANFEIRIVATKMQER